MIDTDIKSCEEKYIELVIDLHKCHCILVSYEVLIAIILNICSPTLGITYGIGNVEVRMLTYASCVYGLEHVSGIALVSTCDTERLVYAASVCDDHVGIECIQMISEISCGAEVLLQ